MTGRIPSNARRAPHAAAWREPVRSDPIYDDPRPFDWRELLDPWLWIAAAVCLFGFGSALVLIFASVPAPVQ